MSTLGPKMSYCQWIIWIANSTLHIVCNQTQYTQCYVSQLIPTSSNLKFLTSTVIIEIHKNYDKINKIWVIFVKSLPMELTDSMDYTIPVDIESELVDIDDSLLCRLIKYPDIAI